MNGEYFPIEEAKVSINDRGFQFGDSVYEVLKVYRGKVWAYDRHLTRLANSLAGIELTGVDVEQVGEAALETLRRSELLEALVYVQVTRGAAPRQHENPQGLTPTMVVTVRQEPDGREELRKTGAKAITVPDTRWGRPDIKSTNLLPNIMAKTHATEAGAYEALFVNDRGVVTEASAMTCYAVIEGVIRTHPLGTAILAGVTRAYVRELAEQLHFPLREEAFLRSALSGATEVFLSGTSAEILGVVEVDGEPVGDGRVGPVARQLQEAYRKLIAETLGFAW